MQWQLTLFNHLQDLLELVKNTPHAPGRLFVGAPQARWGGIDVGSETRIFNLDSDEFSSNPPLKI